MFYREIKNLIIYEMPKERDQAEFKRGLQSLTDNNPFIPCEGIDSSRMGFVEHDFLASRYTLLVVKQESKLLPNDVIKQKLNEKIEKQELAQNRKLSKTEKASLKDEVMIDLLPRAFSKYKYFHIAVDHTDSLVFVFVSSFKQAEDLLALIRKNIGTLALTPFSSEQLPETTLTHWFNDGVPVNFEIQPEVLLKDPIESKAAIRANEIDVLSREMKAHLGQGMKVNALSLGFKNGVTFTINSDLTIKKIKFDKSITDDIESAEDERTQKVIILNLISLLIKELKDVF